MRRFPAVDGALWDQAEASFSVRVPRYWAERIHSTDGPLGLQVLPRPQELLPDPGDRADPVGEGGHSPVPWVVRKYRDRALLKVTRRCGVHCRYCFRRDQRGPEPTADELQRAAAWIRGSGVREAILSGGDPLVLPDARLLALIDALRPDVPVVRIHSRAPIVEPSRVSPALVEALRARAPVWMVVHVNHPVELGDEVRAALGRLVDGGVPVLSQSVLLTGVNDDPEILASLFERLVSLRVRPHYLHHPDPVPGNGGFRLSMDRGLGIWSAVRARVGGTALPRYVIDPPDGSGKVDVARFVEDGRAVASGRLAKET